MKLKFDQHNSVYTLESVTSKFDLICHCETYLNSETLSDDGNLKIPGLHFKRKDHPSDGKRERDIVYNKKSLQFNPN